MTLSILIADDHEIFCQGLQMLLSSQADFKVVGQAKNGLEAVALTERLHPDVVIIDILMSGLNGIEATRQIKQRQPAAKVVILSMHDDESYVLNALQHGASAYVLKESSASDLVNAVRYVITGQRFLSPALNERAIDVYIQHGQKDTQDNYDTLTNREREVLQLSVEGLSNPQIAERLSVGIRTAETHRAHMLHKLGLHSQAELIDYARQRKMIFSEDGA